ncbi:DUF262 domain-containing protein [Maricaulis sp. CAU 1757]
MKLTPWEPDLRTLVARIDDKEIDLQPEFQRQEVWSKTKQKKLIDTILREWSIPPVHLVLSPDRTLEVLDGQQRLVAVRDFFHNRFAIDGQVTPRDDSILGLNRKLYRQLDTVTRRQIEGYSIKCFRITDYKPEEPSELFYRLNQPTVLTAGEQRNALFGPARDQLKKIVAHFEESGSEKGTIGFSNVRLAYDDVIARLLYFIERRSIGVKSTESRISERFRQKDPFSEHVFQRAINSINLFSSARENLGSIRLNKASLLSLLIFFSREGVGNQPLTDILALIAKQNCNHRSELINTYLAIFEDRSSLRVTDVTSVVLRDIALSVIYEEFYNAAPPLPYYRRISSDLKRVVNDSSGLAPDDFVINAIDLDEWSSQI